MGRMVIPKDDSLSKKYLQNSYNTSGYDGNKHSGTAIGDIILFVTLLLIPFAWHCFNIQYGIEN